MINKLAIVGLGLIGGSLARALKKKGCVAEVVGTGRREASLIKAQELGVIDRWTLDLGEAVAKADVVVIATPTLVAEKVLADLKPYMRENLIVTDVASVKGSLVEAARRIFGDLPPQFVPGHPIAGSEQSGVEASREDLYINHRVILTPTEATDKDALAVIRAMWENTGAEVLDMPVDEHDRVLAATSHLPHVLAYALVDALASNGSAEQIFKFAAGGFRDFTRIASSDPVMWHDIVRANREAVLSSMDDFTARLAELRTAIGSDDSAEILDTFTRAKAARDDHFLSQYQGKTKE